MLGLGEPTRTLLPRRAFTLVLAYPHTAWKLAVALLLHMLLSELHKSLWQCRHKTASYVSIHWEACNGQGMMLTRSCGRHQCMGFLTSFCMHEL
jgi:hypothetical protein